MYMPTPYNPRTEQLETLVDDVLERQDAGGPGAGGLSAGYDIRQTALAHPLVRYSGKFGEFVLTTDLYPDPEGGMMLHLYCPVCSTPEKPHNLRISSSRKKMEYDKNRGISVETFACTWELPEADTRKMEFGMGLCRWRVIIENNVARDV
jgi:hypothetical protein